MTNEERKEILEAIRKEIRQIFEEVGTDMGSLMLVSELYLSLVNRTQELEKSKEEIKRLEAEVRTLRSKFKQSIEKEEGAEAEAERNPLLRVFIMDSGLPLKVAQPLHYGKYAFENLEQVIRFTRKELLTIRGFGGKRLCELEAFLESHGLSLKE